MKRRRKGFTIIESLMALFIVAVGVGAMLEAISFYNRQSALVSEQMWSQLIAWNELAKLYVVSDKVADINDNAFKVDFLSRDWHAQRTSKEVVYDGIHQVDLAVGPVEGKPSVRFSLLVHQP